MGHKDFIIIYTDESCHTYKDHSGLHHHYIYKGTWKVKSPRGEFFILCNILPKYKRICHCKTLLPPNKKDFDTVTNNQVFNKLPLGPFLKGNTEDILLEYFPRTTPQITMWTYTQHILNSQHPRPKQQTQLEQDALIDKALEEFLSGNHSYTFSDDDNK
jgi:hypothetical protein